MEIASLILGIVSIIIVFVPFIWVFSIITAIVGLVLGVLALVKKLDKKKSTIGVVLCSITMILVIITFNNIMNTFNNINTTTSTNIETGKQETISNEELVKNVTAEALGITANGDFAFKVKNNNSQAVYIDTINTVFKDSNGNFMEKAKSQDQFFGIAANSEVINYARGFDKDFSKYSNYEFEVELSGNWMSERKLVNNFEIIANNTGKQISVQVKNNNDVLVSNISIIVAYYKDGKIVGCENGYANDTTTKANGTAYINIDYPEDSHYQEVQFDKYETYLLEATAEY